MSIFDIFRKKKRPFTIRVAYDYSSDSAVYLSIVLKPGWKIESTLPVMNNFIISLVKGDTND